MENSEFLKFVQLDQLPLALVAVALAWISTRVITRILGGLGERFGTRRLLLKQVASLSRVVILFLTVIFVATTLVEFSNEAVLALSGTAAVAFGFAFKDILASIMAGLILLFDRPFQVGDRISFAGYYGEVVEIGLRSVRLVTLDDNLVSVPCNKFLTDGVASANAGELHQMVVLHFYIGCNEDFDRAKRIIYDAAASSRYVYLDKPIEVNLRERAVEGMATFFALELTLKAYVFDGRFEIAFGTDVTERVKRAFKEKRIHTVGELLAPATASASTGA
jgi:small-conductance mechanosensitive channel